MKRLLLFLWVALVAFPLCAQEDAVADSTALPTDLHTSLLVCDPGGDFYSCYGHCALRMECPSAGLDYTFSYFLEDNLANRTEMFRGKGVGSYVAMKTSDFLSEYRLTQRGVVAYEVNLAVEQKRELWQLLDQEVARKFHRKYNYLHTNCSSMCIYALERVLGHERIVCDSFDAGITGTYREFIGRISEGQPWTGFFWTSILGSDGDTYGQQEDKMAPMLLAKSLMQMQIATPEGTLRPFVVGTPTTLLPHHFTIRPTQFTPTHFFLLLLVLAVGISLWQLKGSERARRWAYAYDALLLALQTVAGLGIFYLSCISDMDGASRNWNLLVLNPLPALVWILFRRRRWYRQVFKVYAVAILAYVSLLLFTPQVDFLRVLMVSPLLVRCLFCSRK